MSISPAQMAANRANAQHSTGPVTPEGKAKSSQNRRSHGFRGTFRFIQGEDPQEFRTLCLDLYAEHQPRKRTARAV